MQLVIMLWTFPQLGQIIVANIRLMLSIMHLYAFFFEKNFKHD